MGKGSRKRNERAQSALATAAPRKAVKKEMPTWVGTVIVLTIVAALVIFAVATALSSRGTFNRMRNVVETEHFEVTVPMMSYMVYTQYQNYVAQIQSYGSGNISIKGDSTGEALDTSKPLRDQIYSAKEGEDVVTWFDHFVGQAEDNVLQVLACCEAAYEAGVELDDADYEVIAAELSVFDTYAAQYGYSTNAYVGMMYGEGVRLKDLEKMSELTQLATKWTTQKKQEFFQSVDVEAINAYYAANQSTYDVFCDVIGYSFTATFTPDSKGDATKNAELAAEYAKDQARFAGYLEQLKAATTKETLKGAILNCIQKEQEYQFLKNKEEGYALTDADRSTISAAANSLFENVELANVAKGDFSSTHSTLDTWLFESKTEDGKTVYQRKAGETKELNEVNNVKTDSEEAENNYQKVTSTYGFYIFLDGMHRDFSPSVGHILFKNDTYDGLVNSAKLTGLAKTLADRIFEENKDVKNFVLTADAMAAELFEMMQEAGEISTATREDGSTYYVIDKEVFNTYGSSYTEDSNVFYEGVAKGVMVAPFEDWAYGSQRRAGEISAEAIETDYGYHIMFYEGIAWESSIRNTITTEKNDAYLESIQEGVEFNIKSNNYDRIGG